MKTYVGTSGYSYKEWKGSFYPKDLPAKEMLSHYASRLPAVEINNTFYKLPQITVLENWKQQVSETFRFTLKASQRITHFKRLKDVEAEASYFIETAGALENQLGAILVQLPPNMKKDLERLAAFLKHLPATVRVAFEFRHPTWFDNDVLALLHDSNRALCVSDTDEQPVTHIDKTADWGYLRLRRVNYAPEDLASWAKRIAEQQWESVFVFFKHEDEGTGPRLAGQFLELVVPPSAG